MKPIYVTIIFIMSLALVGICSIIKFITELKNEGTKTLAQPMLENDKFLLRFSKNLGVISLRDNHSYVASERFPYVAAIIAKSRKKGMKFSCFGCIILMKWIVTAAHCRKPNHSHRVLLYFDYVRNHTQTYPILLWKTHEQYNPNSTHPLHDIAVAKISVNVVPIISHAAVFTSKSVKQIQASIWKTVMTMERETYLTNDLAVYDADLTSHARCYEHFGITLDDTLICVDMTKHSDCFVTEFGPIYAYQTDRVVGILTVKPRDCDSRVAIFTNVSSYFDWIIRATGTGDEGDQALRAPVETTTEEDTLPSY